MNDFTFSNLIQTHDLTIIFECVRNIYNVSQSFNVILWMTIMVLIPVYEKRGGVLSFF